MISAAISAFPLAALILSTNPFADDATVTYEDNGYVSPVMAYNSDFPYYNAPPKAADKSPIHSYFPTASLNLECGCESTVIDIGQEIGLPITFSDWSTVFRIYYDLQIENVEDFEYPIDVAGGLRIGRIMAHLRASLQTIHAAFLRDTGVDLKVRNVIIREQGAAAGVYPVYADQLAVAASRTYGIPNLSHYLMRISHRISGGMSIGTVCNPATAYGHAGYFLNASPTNGPVWPGTLRVLAHELGHGLLKLDHTQCYRDANDQPLEACYDVPCYLSPTICPPRNEISFMSYCSACYSGPAPEQRYPFLRLGPTGGLMSIIARQLVLTSECAEPIGTMFPKQFGQATPIDYDYDEIHSFLDLPPYADDPFFPDNCPYAPNNNQFDSDFDGKGDACDFGCQITETNQFSFWPFLPLTFLIWSRKNANLHRRRPYQTNR